MANLADLLEQVIKEGLSPDVRDIGEALDPTFKDIFSTSIGVTRDDIGRDYKAIHTFLTGLAGGFQAEASGSIEGDTLAFGTGTAEPGAVIAPATVSTWPGMADSTMRGSMQRTLQLKRWKGNLFMPVEVVRADRLTAAISSVFSQNVKAWAKLIATLRANLFFGPTSNRRICSMTVTTAATQGGTETLIGYTSDRIARIVPGMLVDVYQSNGTTQMNDTPAIVKTVNRPVQLTNLLAGGTTGNISITLTSGDWAQASDATAIIVPHNSHSGSSATVYGPTSPRQWMVASGTVFGVNYAHWPQFASYVEAVSASLTADILKTRLGCWMDVMDPERWPDRMLTTAGVISDYVGEVDDLRLFQVQGQSLNYKGGFGGASFEYDGNSIPFQAGRLMPTGELWAMKVRNNIKRYVPPRMPNAQSQAGFEGDIEFSGPNLGYKGIWAPYTKANTSTGAVSLTPYVQCPVELVEEYAPESTPGVILTGLTEFTK